MYQDPDHQKRSRKIEFNKYTQSTSQSITRDSKEPILKHMHKKVLWFILDKMSDMEKSYSFHSVILPASHVVTTECFMSD